MVKEVTGSQTAQMKQEEEQVWVVVKLTTLPEHLKPRRQNLVINVVVRVIGPPPVQIPEVVSLRYQDSLLGADHKPEGAAATNVVK